jgi:hypothetical protein
MTVLPEQMTGSPRMGEIVRDALRTYRERFWRVAGTAFVVFGVVAAIDAIGTVLVIDEHVSRPAGAAVTSVVSAVLALAGTVMYAGILDRVVGAHLHGHPDRPMREIIRGLPLGRLAVADIVLALVTLIGLALFVVPGVIVFTLAGLVGPVITIEDRSVMSAFKRSVEIVRPCFWQTFVLVTLPLQVEQAVLHAIHYTDIFEHPAVPAFFLNGILGSAIGSVVGLVEVVLAYELIARAAGKRTASPLAAT